MPAVQVATKGLMAINQPTNSLVTMATVAPMVTVVPKTVLVTMGPIRKLSRSKNSNAGIHRCQWCK